MTKRKEENSENKIVLGIDQSYSNFGFAVYDGEKFLESGSFKLGNIERFDKRKIIRDRFEGLKKKYKIDLVVYEQTRLFNANATVLNNIVLLAELAMVINESFHEYEKYTVDSRSWKSKVLGKAGATKDDSVSYILENYSVKVCHDEADAMCIAKSYYSKAKLNYVAD